jgi:hypothetical protein
MCRFPPYNQMGGKRFTLRNCTVMTVQSVIRLQPEYRVIICIEAISMHYYFTVSSWWLGDEGLIRSGDEIFSTEEESADFAICHTNFPCKNAFRGQAIVNLRFDILQSTLNLSKSTSVSTAVISTNRDNIKRGGGNLKGLPMV